MVVFSNNVLAWAFYNQKLIININRIKFRRKANFIFDENWFYFRFFSIRYYFAFPLFSGSYQLTSADTEDGVYRLSAVNFSLTNSETKRESALVCFGILTSKDRIISSIHKNIKELQEVCFDTQSKRENI